MPTLVEPGDIVELFRPIAAGTYFVDDPFPVKVTFTVTNDWRIWAYTNAATQVNVVKPDVGEVSFEVVDNVSADPCTGELADPPIGLSVDDLVVALSDLGEFGFEVSPATDIMIDGFNGKQLTLQAPPTETPACDGWLTWRTTTRQNGVGPGEASEVRILDVDGVRLLISAVHDPALPEAAMAEITAVLESLQIRE